MTGQESNGLASGLSLWVAQALAVARLEIGRNFLSLRSLGLYAAAGFFVVICFIGLVVVPIFEEGYDPGAGERSQFFANLFDTLMLRVVVFFVCLVIFTRLIRAEVQEKSLHYYFLAPLKRPVLMAGKFLAGVVAASIMLCASAGLAYVVSFLTLDAGIGSHFLRGPGLLHLGIYLGLTILGVIGYGAIFLAAGLFVRNAILPAILVFGWEWLNFLLPPALKKLSVIHYLHSLLPVPVSEGPLATMVSPTSPWLAVPGLLIFAAALLVLSSRYIQTMEISYSDE